MKKPSRVRKWLPWLFPEYPPLRGEDVGDLYAREAWEVERKGSERIEAVWTMVRKFVMRGSSAGALAALTLFGSQTLKASPWEAVFWPLMIFVLSLGCGFAQLGMSIVEAMAQRAIDSEAVWGDGNKPVPARIIAWVMRAFDLAAIVLMLFGIGMGLDALYGLTQQGTCPN